ncbi:hypothetical protein [Stenotrophomonas sp.]|uniref:DUF6941 family protein n=1 Tax=Stenotrophomonas sp. TaxID=69392 RepID=UPI0028A5A277|nr:hypothetical protein [Stenotrophomonas sp.]
MNIEKSKDQLLRTRGAHTIFCDDIRQESSGKLLIVGMYGDSLTVPSFPCQLPDLRLMITMTSPIEVPFESAEIRVSFDREVLMTMSLDDPSTPDMSVGPSDEDVSAGVMRVHHMTAFMVLESVNIEKPGNLLVRIQTESELIPAGALYVSEAES